MHQKQKTVIILIACFILVFSSAFVPAPVQNQQDDGDVIIRVTQVDTSHFPQVVVYISAVDASGNPTVIDANNIVLRENDQPVKTGLIEGAGDSGPLTTMLVMDVSGSMKSGGKLKMAKKVAGEYVAQMRANDMAGIIAFNTQVDQVQPITQDHVALQAAIEDLTAENDTAMYDALVKAADILNPLTGRKAVIVLTDGLDNRSKHSPTDVINSIGESGLSISTIGLGNPGQSTGNITALDEKTLAALAENAGGSYSLATDQESLQKVYEQYGRVLRSEYAITYTSQSTLRDGINRNLSVSLEEGGIAKWSSPVKTRYNPGGLVPEVASAASWPIFFGILAGLAVLLFLPAAFRLIKRPEMIKEKAPMNSPAKPPRIKLK